MVLAEHTHGSWHCCLSMGEEARAQLAKHLAQGHPASKEQSPELPPPSHPSNDIKTVACPPDHPNAGSDWQKAKWFSLSRDGRGCKCQPFCSVG